MIQQKLSRISLGTLIKLYLAVFIFEILIFAPISSLIGIEQMPHAVDDLFGNFSYWQVFALAVLIAPVLEELIFRYHLRYESLSFLFVSIALLSLTTMILDYYFGIFSLINFQTYDYKTVVLIAIFLSTVILIPVIILYSLKAELRIGNPSQEWRWLNFPFVFYLSILVFAFVHVYNFDLAPSKWYLTPLMVMPQFILGAFIAWVRIRLSMVHCIFIHMLNNAIPMIVVLLNQSIF